jgi:TolB-like protein/DNA-binding winged helix-turn-helix (wHTH) protein/Flp pilus assembly protein TadD
MASSLPLAPKVRFGAFELDESAGRLLKAGIPLKLQPQPFRVLILLISRPGQVVTREEIQQHLWGDSTFVDFERGINFSINQIRGALCDDAENPRYIETLPRLGYRFIGTLHHENGDIDGPATPFLPSAPKNPLKDNRGNRSFGRLWPLYFSLLALAGLIGWAAVRGRSLWQGATPARIRSLAVLPLANLSGNPAQDYFADGMTDELLTDLARLPNTRVISRTSAMRYKGTRKSVPEIARELNVDGILEGSVMRFGDRVRIRIQLIYAPRDQHVWAAAYERDLKDVLALQEDAARDIADELKLELTGQQQAHLSKSRPVSPEVHELYLKGRYFWNKRDESALNSAVEYFQEAIAKDPNYAEAYAGLADSYILLFGYADATPSDALTKAKAAAEKALQLDDSLAEAHASLAIIAPYFDWNWEESQRQYERALQLNPNYATVHHWYGDTYLAPTGKVNQAIEEIRRAQELDPLSTIIATDLGKQLIFARRYGEAFPQLRRALELDPNFGWAHFWLWYACTETGRYSDAYNELEKARSSVGPNRFLAFSAYTGAKAGDTVKARKTLAQLLQTSHRDVRPVAVSYTYIALGEKDQAFSWLEKAYLARSPDLEALKNLPAFDPLRSDPRFSNLIRRVGLPQ